MQNINIKNIIIFISSFLTIIFIYVNFTTYTSSLDIKIREYFFKYRGEIETTKNVVIVDIDEKSIKQLGQWPFSRDTMAQVLANLTNSKVGIIGLDIIFSEKDRSSPSFMAEVLKLEGKYQDNDILLGNIVANTPTILGYFFSDEKNYINDEAPNIAVDIKYTNKNLISSSGVVTNIDSIQRNSYSSGFFNAFGSFDGKIYNMPLLLEYKNKVYPSLAFEMVRIASGSQETKIIEDEFGLRGIKLDNLFIPTDSNGFLSINYRGPKKSFKYLSFVDILKGNYSQEDVAGKFVLIGTSAITLADLRASVFDLSMPGVEIHANIIDNILKGDFLHKHTSSVAIDTISIFLLTVVLGIVLLFLNASLIFPLALIFGSSLYIFYYNLLFTHGIIVDLFYPLISIISTTVISIVIKYFKEQKQKDFIKSKFSKKVSPAVVADLLNNKNDEFKGSKKVVSIFFSDIRDFTSLSEKINNPEKLIKILNLYMEPMVEEIIKTQGTIDKFIGDAIMAYWNAPQDIKNHADEAVKSAINQIKKLDELNIKLKEEYDLSLDIGIGIHTGEAVVGEMGSKGRSDYTIIGDNVNLASRIEGLTKLFGVKILISEETKQSLKEKYLLKELALISVKGKSNAVKLYEVSNSNKKEEFDLINSQYLNAKKLYENKNFSEAIESFKKLDEIQAHKINNFYIQAAQDYIDNPQKEFSLVFSINSK